MSLRPLPSAGLPGDYNRDNLVNAANQVVWRKTDSTTQEYNIRRDNFGATLGSGSGASPNPASVPEPASISIVTALCYMVLRWNKVR